VKKKKTFTIKPFTFNKIRSVWYAIHGCSYLCQDGGLREGCLGHIAEGCHYSCTREQALGDPASGYFDSKEDAIAAVEKAGFTASVMEEVA
jgi:hypothetical protein